MYWYKKRCKKDKQKMVLKKIFKIDGWCSFWKNYEKCEKYRDIKLVIKKKERGKYLVSEPNFHITMFFTENLLAIKIKKNANENNTRIK